MEEGSVRTRGNQLKQSILHFPFLPRPRRAAPVGVPIPSAASPFPSPVGKAESAAGAPHANGRDLSICFEYSGGGFQEDEDRDSWLRRFFHVHTPRRPPPDPPPTSVRIG